MKSGVTKAHVYDPDINPTYHEMAAYYSTAIMPARPYKPRDKPIAEAGVQVVERWILARLRHTTFYNLTELNHGIRELLEELNHKPFQKKEGSRYSHFKEYEQKELKSLPLTPYEYAIFKRLKVTPDYHIPYEHHFYSVPHRYVGQRVDLRITAHTIEIMHQGQRIASHVRQPHVGTTTLPEHQPETHRRHREWTPETCMKWAKDLGQSTYLLMIKVSQKTAHPQQLYRLFLGFLKLTRYFGEKRLESACQRALFYEQASYKKVQYILEKGLDQEQLPTPLHEQNPIDHKNIRGSHYYK